MIHKIEGSSNVDTIDYDPIEKILKIVYKGGGEYWYQPVTATQHTLLMNTPSKGSFLATSITKNKNIMTTKKTKGGTQATIVRKSETTRVKNSLKYTAKQTDMTDFLDASHRFHEILRNDKD